MKPDTSPNIAMHMRALGLGANPEMLEWLRKIEAHFLEHMKATGSPSVRENIAAHLGVVRACIEAEVGRG